MEVVALEAREDAVSLSSAPTTTTRETLRAVLESVLKAGKETDTSEYGGSSNFDGAMIHLPRVKTSMNEEAIKQAYQKSYTE